MVVLTYTLLGPANPPCTKTFNTRQECDLWLSSTNVRVISIESSGVSTLNKLYGGL